MKYLAVIRKGDVVLERLTVSATSLTNAREKTDDWAKNRFVGSVHISVREMNRGCYTEDAICHQEASRHV